MEWISLAEQKAQYRHVWWDVAQGPDILLPNLAFSLPLDAPVPDPDPVVWAAIFWRPDFDSCGYFTVASHCWGVDCHLETASECHSSPLQGR